MNESVQNGSEGQRMHGTALVLVDSRWDRVLDEALEADPTSVQIVCPFIKRSVAGRFLQAGVPKSLRVITRFDKRDFFSRVSDLDALRLFLDAGAQIRGIRRLHAKLYLLGRKAVVTSANLTEAALLHNHELGFVSGW